MAHHAGWRVFGALLLVTWGGHGVRGELKVSSCLATESGCPYHHLQCGRAATVSVLAARRIFNVTDNFCRNFGSICEHNCCLNVAQPFCEPAVNETVLQALEQNCSERHNCIVEINPGGLYCGLLSNSKIVLQSHDSRIEYKCTPVPTTTALSTKPTTTSQETTTESPTQSTGFSNEEEDVATMSSTETEIRMEGTGHATNSTRGDHPGIETQGYFPLIVGGAAAGGATLLLVCVLLVCWRKRRPLRGKMRDGEGIAVGNPAYEEGGGLVDIGRSEDEDNEYDVLRSRRVRQPAQPEGLYGHLGAAADQSDDGLYDVTGNSKKCDVIDNVYDHAVNVCSKSVTDDACDVSTNATEVKDTVVENARDLDENVPKDDVIESAQDDVTEHVYGNATG